MGMVLYPTIPRGEQPLLYALLSVKYLSPLDYLSSATLEKRATRRHLTPLKAPIYYYLRPTEPVLLNRYPLGMGRT